MRITKREWVSPIATMNLWFIPTMAYTMQKLVGVKFNENEWYWWIVIPVLFAVWFAINFKIDKQW